MKTRKAFSFPSRWQSIRDALAGIRSFFVSEPNAAIHLSGTLLVIVLAIVLPVTNNEVLVLIIVTGAVWTAELFNTAVEKTTDLVTNDRHPSVKFIKDVAAAAVLVTAITALVAGLVIFIPKIMLLC